jgi:hypothetical protein
MERILRAKEIIRQCDDIISMNNKTIEVMTTQILKQAEAEIIHRLTKTLETEVETRRIIIEAVCDKYHIHYNVMFAQLGLDVVEHVL